MPGIKDIIDRPEDAGVAPVHTPAFTVAAPPKPAAPKREKFVGFVRDEASAQILHQAMASAFPNGAQFHVVDFRTSLAILGGMTTPEIILVDLSGEDQPINAMMDLAEVVEPGTVVLAIGETHNVNFYRTVTRGMGVREYLARPLTVESVQRHFLELTNAELAAAAAPRGGRMVAVMGARGGVGTTTIASNLAWMIGTEMHRHTVLVDADLQSGTVALGLNVRHDKGLCTALETPERVDHLLIERSTQVAGERLHVLAALEALDRDIGYNPKGAATVVQALRSRYNFVVVDAGSRLLPFARDLVYQAHQRVIVLDPTLVSIRNLERLLDLPGGPLQSPRAVLALNMAGGTGAVSQALMEQTLGLRFDAVIPEVPRIVPKAVQLGKPAAETRGPFRSAMQQLANAVGARLLDEVEPAGKRMAVGSG
jgi:pilus assembly protein CpaE